MTVTNPVEELTAHAVELPAEKVTVPVPVESATVAVTVSPIFIE